MREPYNWFSLYTDFAYDPTAGLKSNFDRLAVQRKWGHRLKARRWSECQTTMFASLYGYETEVSKLERWQDLCREVLINDPPNSISGCRKVWQIPLLLEFLVLIHRFRFWAIVRFLLTWSTLSITVSLEFQLFDSETTMSSGLTPKKGVYSRCA